MSCVQFSLLGTGGFEHPKKEDGPNIPTTAHRHRVIPYESMLRDRFVARLTAATTRIAELEVELVEVGSRILRSPRAGALTPRGLQIAFDLEVGQALQTGKPLSVALIDLCTPAQPELVDEVTGALTRAISLELRQEDICGTTVDGKIVVVLAGADRDTANQVLLRLHAVVGTRVNGTIPGHCRTFACVVRYEGGSLDEIVRRAGRVVARAKSELTL
jgi:GGDEF domain-containing protein